VVSAVGNVEHDSLVRKVRAALEAIPGGKPRKLTQFAEPSRRAFAAQERAGEQAHLVYGCPWYEAGADDRFAGSLLVSILGGSMSSRLFQEVREKRGLAYSIMAGASVFSDAGQFYVYCGTRPDNLAQASKIIRREVARVADEAPSDAELKRACEVICGQLLLGVESTSERMVRLGRRETMGLPQVEVPDLIERYRSVTPQDVREVAARYLTQQPTACVVSPFSAEEAQVRVFGR
jgi:predicted Zn-dependent peptidase